MIVIFQTKYEPHSEKRPAIVYQQFKSWEELSHAVNDNSLRSILDDYNILIMDKITCKKCGLEISYELYQYNRMCNRCDQNE